MGGSDKVGGLPSAAHLSKVDLLPQPGAAVQVQCSWVQGAEPPFGADRGLPSSAGARLPLE